MNKKIKWFHPKEKLPEDNTAVLTYHCGESGIPWYNVCIYIKEKNIFKVSHLYEFEPNSWSRCPNINDEEWPYYDIEDIECWLDLDDLHPYHENDRIKPQFFVPRRSADKNKYTHN